MPSYPCVDPVETAADKLSALAWRVLARDRTRARDDPTIIRHLHDLAALERHVVSAPRFAELVLAAAPAMPAGEGKQRVAATRRRSSPRCCSGWKAILYGQGSMRNSCDRYRSPAPALMRALHAHA